MADAENGLSEREDKNDTAGAPEDGPATGSSGRETEMCACESGLTFGECHGLKFREDVLARDKRNERNKKERERRARRKLEKKAKDEHGGAGAAAQTGGAEAGQDDGAEGDADADGTVMGRTSNIDKVEEREVC